MKTLIIILIFAVFVFSNFGTLAFAGGTSAEGSRWQPGTADLGPSPLWANNGLDAQVALGVTDAIFIGAAQIFEEPQFRQALRNYTEQRRIEKTLEKQFRLHPWSTRQVAWANQAYVTDQANRQLQQIARQIGAKRIPYATVRWLGTGVFAADLGSRIAYYYYVQEDPGWFPMVKVWRAIEAHH